MRTTTLVLSMSSNTTVTGLEELEIEQLTRGFTCSPGGGSIGGAFLLCDPPAIAYRLTDSAALCHRLTSS